MKRVFIFGDSILRGVYFSRSAGRHKLFSERFSLLKARGADVVNCSVMGATVSTGERLVKKKLGEGSGGDDVVIFEYGGNDADYLWKAISENPGGKFEPNTPEDCFAVRYGSCVEYAKSVGARVLLCSLVPLDTEKYMDWISRGLSRSSILSWLGDPQILLRRQHAYSRTAESVAARHGCPFIDLWTPFCDRVPELISDDGIHPDPEGHRLIDSLITEAIE